jgi:hypothetical protein
VKNAELKCRCRRQAAEDPCGHDPGTDECPLHCDGGPFRAGTVVTEESEHDDKYGVVLPIDSQHAGYVAVRWLSPGSSSLDYEHVSDLARAMEAPVAKAFVEDWQASGFELVHLAAFADEWAEHHDQCGACGQLTYRGDPPHECDLDPAHACTNVLHDAVDCPTAGLALAAWCPFCRANRPSPGRGTIQP